MMSRVLISALAWGLIGGAVVLATSPIWSGWAP